MKKVLLTSTALIATAGMAAAEINFSGGARLGVVYIEDTGTIVREQDFRLEKRMTINIDGSGETESGLTFGGRIRLRSDESDAAGSAISSSNVFIGGDTWKVTVGNTSGALVNRLNYFDGTIGLDGHTWSNVSFNMGTNTFYLDTFSSRGGGTSNVVRLDFNVGDFGVSLSTSATGDFTDVDSEENAIAASYNFGDWTVAAGFAANALGTNDTASLGVSGSIGDFGVGFQVTDTENVGTKVVLSGSYSFGDTSVTGYIANTDEDTVGSAGIGAAGEDTEFGLGFTHSLGGATLVGGISRNFTDTTRASLGVRFQF